MFTRTRDHTPYFQGVAIALILAGASIFAIGSLQWLLNFFADYGFASPSFKIIGGLVVTALGYIHLELELQRIK